MHQFGAEFDAADRRGRTHLCSADFNKSLPRDATSEETASKIASAFSDQCFGTCR
jgi:hypothetical protein